MTNEPNVTESPFDAADRLAPVPATRDDATRDAWVRHFAATALAAYATFRAEVRTITPSPATWSRPDLGYLAMLGVSATAALVALTADQVDAPGLIWDLTPEAGALNGEYEKYLTDVLVRYGINPAEIDPDLEAADFAEAVAANA